MKKALFMLLILACATSAHANWVDDWMTNKTETSPGYFSGQQRGYYTGGGFNARWGGGGTAFPVTVQPPKIKAGCGGIDIFMGGFSFLNADWLVQKLQAILANAPAVAFDLALNTLCTPCAAAIKWMEDLSDKLNALQLDACKISQITVAKLYEAGGSDNAQVKGLAERSYEMETGISNFAHNSGKQQEARGNEQASSDYVLLDGCQSDVKDIFIGTDASGTGSIVVNAGSKMGYDASYLHLARGLFGDIAAVQQPNSSGIIVLKFLTLDRCPGNPGDAEGIIQALAKNTAMSRPALTAGNCVPADSAAIQTMVVNTLQSIADKMRTKSGGLSTEEDAMMQRVPLPLFNILKAAIATGQEGSTIMVMSDAVTKAYAYAVIRDIYDVLSKTILAAERVRALAANKRANCQIELLEDAWALLRPFKDNLGAKILPFQEAASRSLDEINKTLETASRFEAFDKKSKSELGSLFIPSLVNRAIQ